MYTLSINMWFQKLIRQFFFNLDKVVYGFITTVYDLLISIARTSILSQADIINMADKIYKLLAVFMVFKVTFSLIMYVVNPDDFSDKSKGVSKLGLNIVISLALLILVPYMFSAAFRLQTIILEDNSLAELIMGSGKDEDGNSNASFLNDAGDTIAFYSIQPFFLPNVSLEGLEECITIEIDGKFNDKCYTSLIEKKVNSTLVNNYKYGIENQNMGLTFRQDLAIATDSGNDNFIMEYRFILSTVLGIVVVLILITFCMDVALRSIKLSFLQLIAPIPIISYVDPKSGKDGMFKKWYQMCFKTYASLFLRLIALYFAVYIISRVGRLTDIVDGSQVTNGFIKIFIIIGALMFAKQLPKILEGLGVKLDGGFKLNPLKKFEEEAIGGKKITGAARGALVGTAGMLTGAGVMAGVSGAFRGFTSGKGWAESGKATAEMNRKMRQARITGSTFGGRMGARFANTTGLISQSERIAAQKQEQQNQIDLIDNQIKAVEEEQKRIKGSADYVDRKNRIKDQKALADSIKAMEERAKSEIEHGNSFIGQQYLYLKAEYERLKASGTASAAELSEAENNMNQYLNDVGMKLYLEKATSGEIDDASFRNMRATAEQAATYAGITLDTTGAGIHSQFGAAKGAIGDLERAAQADDRRLAELDDQIADYNRNKSTYNDRIRELSREEAIAKSNESAIK